MCESCHLPSHDSGESLLPRRRIAGLLLLVAAAAVMLVAAPGGHRRTAHPQSGGDRVFLSDARTSAEAGLALARRAAQACDPRSAAAAKVLRTRESALLAALGDPAAARHRSDDADPAPFRAALIAHLDEDAIIARIEIATGRNRRLVGIAKRELSGARTSVVAWRSEGRHRCGNPAP